MPCDLLQCIQLACIIGRKEERKEANKECYMLCFLVKITL